FVLNVQHDCNRGNCQPSGTHFRKQERIETMLTEAVIEHAAMDLYIVNTHFFYHLHLLWKIMPRHLITLTPLFADQYRHHCKLAAHLRVTSQAK
ncbi:hypothetical protein OBBRIDRAFT_714772, partial [Obba rivulosa]